MVIYRILRNTKGFSLLVVAEGFQRVLSGELSGAEESSYCCSCFVQGCLDPILPPSLIGNLHTKLLRKKSKKRRKCPSGRAPPSSAKGRKMPSRPTRGTCCA